MRVCVEGWVSGGWGGGKRVEGANVTVGGVVFLGFTGEGLWSLGSTQTHVNISEDTTVLWLFFAVFF